MEEKQNNQSAGNVMDIQPQNKSPQPAPVASEAPLPSSPAVDEKPLAAVPTGVMPEESQPTQNTGLSPELLAAAQKETNTTSSQPSSNALLEAKAGAKKPKKPIAIVIIAIVVFSALAGLAAYAYTQKQDHDTRSDTSQTEQAAPEPAGEQIQPATTDDVEEAANELDNAVNSTDEASELPDEGLTEESTGL